MIRLFLAFNFAVFFAFGLYAFFYPSVMMDILGAPSMSSDGIYELRGIYGGVSIGAALLFLAGAMNADMQRSALYFILAYTGGYGLARIAALPLDGMPSGRLAFFAGFEIISALVALYLLRRRAS